jgi:hypothetical protein
VSLYLMVLNNSHYAAGSECVVISLDQQHSPLSRPGLVSWFQRTTRIRPVLRWKSGAEVLTSQNHVALIVSIQLI